MSEATILIGAVAYDPKVLAFWEGMREHFGSQGVNIEFALFSSYEAQVDALLRGHVDVAYNSPLAHMRAKRGAEGATPPGRVHMLAQRDIDRDFQTKILVRRDAGIRALADLHGKTLALGSRDSVQARALPLYFLKRAGVDLAKVNFLPFECDLGKHGDTQRSELDVLAAVHDGRAQVAAVGSVVWQAEQAAGHVDPHKVETLWTTPAYDHHVLDALASFPEPRAQAFQRVLFEMRWNNPRHRRLLEIEGARQWIAPREEGYAHLEKALEDRTLVP